MDWQPFRDNQLWTLEVDDIIRFNLIGIEGLYKKFATYGMNKKIKLFSLKFSAFSWSVKQAQEYPCLIFK